MTIEYWEKVEDAVWWQVAENCDYATFYHTPAWHQMIGEDELNFQTKTIGGQLENGTKFILPMMRTKQIGPFYGLASSIDVLYGGIIADGPITTAEQQQIYEHVVNKWQVISFKLLPPPSKPCNIKSKHFYTVEGSDKTYIIPLAQGFEKIYQNYSRGHKSAVKKATKAGIIIEATDAIEDYRAYYQIYLDSVDRWSGNDLFISQITPWSSFEKTHKLVQEMPGKIKLWVGRLDGEIISGALVFYWNKSVVYYHGANHRDYFAHRGANLIQNEIIKHAAQADLGYETYDFGPSGVSEGVLEFKRRFGAVEKPMTWWLYTHPLLLLLEKIKYRLSHS